MSLIWYLQPKAWFIENPQTGLLNNRPFMHNLPFKDITSCSYGYPFAKKSRIWNNFPSWTPRALLLADSLVLRTLSLIWYLQPKAWFIQNPQTGLLKSRPFMHNLPFKDVTYCSYGYPYAKKTRIWNNFPSWTPRPLCNKTSCPFVENKRHLATAQLGPGMNKTGLRLSNDAFVREQLYSMPPALCAEIAESCHTLWGA